MPRRDPRNSWPRYVKAILQNVQMSAFNPPSDARYGRIRAELDHTGKIIRSHDLLIAVLACAVVATLVTANTNECSRVRGLQVGD